MVPVISKEDFQQKLLNELQVGFNVTPAEASDNQFYKALSSVVVDILRERRHKFRTKNQSAGRKEVYYLSMEFLMGRSLKTSLFNLNINEMVNEIFKEWDVNLERIYEYEPDAGLGNGGLGRLAACYLDGLATDGYPAMGYSICYEYGIFKQKIEDGVVDSEPLTCTCTDKCMVGAVNTACPVCQVAMSECAGKEPESPAPVWTRGVELHLRCRCSDPPVRMAASQSRRPVCRSRRTRTNRHPPQGRGR